VTCPRQGTFVIDNIDSDYDLLDPLSSSLLEDTGKQRLQTGYGEKNPEEKSERNIHVRQCGVLSEGIIEK